MLVARERRTRPRTESGRGWHAKGAGVSPIIIYNNTIFDKIFEELLLLS